MCDSIPAWESDDWFCEREESELEMTDDDQCYSQSNQQSTKANCMKSQEGSEFK